MDFVYMPEVLAYGPLRTPVYRDYEQPWNKDYFNYGKSSQGNHQERVSSQKSKCDQCHLCKQNKRRVLGTYFRKSRSNSCNDIFEEKEEEDEVRDNDKAQKRTGDIKSKLSVLSPRKS